MLGLCKVCDLDGLEADRSLHPESARVWRTGMAEDLLGLILDDLGLTRGHPLHVDVAVALVVGGRDPQGHCVVAVWLQALQVYQQRREQSPSHRTEEITSDETL